MLYWLWTRNTDSGISLVVQSLGICFLMQGTWIWSLVGQLRPSRSQSVQFSHSFVSDSLPPHESQHARPPCPSPTPRVNPNSCPSSRSAIQPSSHPAISSSVSPSPPAPNPSQHQGLFSSSHQVAKVLEFQLQHQSFQWIPRTYLLKDGLIGSPCSPRDSQESSPTPQFQKHQFFIAQLSSQFNSYIHTWPLEKP